MPQPKSPAAYVDLIEGILYRALASPKGLRLTFHSSAEAVHTRFRLFAAIKNLRRQSMEILPEEHPRYGRSDFDQLALILSGTVLEIRPPSTEDLDAKLQAFIEEIT